MELTKEVVQSLAGPCKKNLKLAKSIAEQLIVVAEPLNIARYLFNDKATVLHLLTLHVRENLAKTVIALQGGVPSTKVKVRTRLRLTRDEIESLKKQIVGFITEYPGSSRQRILDAIKVPTLGLYNRVIKELVKDKMLRQKGTTRTAVYTRR